MAVREVWSHFLVVLVLASSYCQVIEAGSAMNIATNATCKSSCEPIEKSCTDCQLAINGLRYVGDWLYIGNTAGAWLKIQFDKMFYVSSLVIVLPYYMANRQFKNIRVIFSDGSEYMIMLNASPDGWIEKEVPIVPSRLSNSITLSVISAYNETVKNINILNEIEVYGTITEETTTSSPETTTAVTSSVTSTSSSSSTTMTLTQTTSKPATSTSAPATSTWAPTTSMSSTTTTTTTKLPDMSTKTTAPPSPTSSSPSLTETTASDTTNKTNIEPPDTKDPWKGRYLYIILAVVASALLIITIVFVCSRKKKSNPLTDLENGGPPKLDDVSPDTDESIHKSEATTAPVTSDIGDSIGEIEGKPIEVDQLAAHVAALRDHQEELEEEFNNLPLPDMERVIRAIQPDVKHKNRFRDVLPYDDTRVPMKTLDIEPASDYTNANYIDGYNHPKRFIAAQGPNDFTVNDFWRMVWEQGSTKVLMLANIVEAGKKKVTQYWPEEEGDVKRYGDIDVIFIRQEQWPDFVVRTFQIKKGDDERIVNHYHFVTWPDRGAPDFASGLISYYGKVANYNGDQENPIIVHCSAGVGRTGTYIALDILTRQAAAEGLVDIYKCVVTMRRQRMHMVQSKEQYEFIHLALMEALLFGGVTISCLSFKEKYEELQAPDENGKSQLDAMYEVLEMFRLKPLEYPVTEATVEENVPKNRCPNVVAGDIHRPHLNPRPDYNSDYVNAVYVDGHRKQNTFFATQMPLPHTRVDLWRLVEDYECIAIVMLNELQSEDETAPNYWPVDDDSMSIGPFTINKTNCDENDGIITTDLEVTSDMTQELPLTLKHIRVVDWPNTQALPTNSNTLLRVFQNLMKWRKQKDNKPILVHCWCGEMRCGMFCCLANVWEKMNEEQEVDVFNVVRQIRMNRPEFLVDQDQYKYMYQFAKEYLESENTYANFQ